MSSGFKGNYCTRMNIHKGREPGNEATVCMQNLKSSTATVIKLRVFMKKMKNL